MIRRAVAPFALVALILVGCGGQGASPARTASSQMRATIVRTLTSLNSTCAYQRWGPLQDNAFGYVPTDGFSAEPPSVSDPIVGTPESGPLPTSYQNDGLGLWENLPNGDYTREDFYVDSTMTQSAGYSTDVIGSDETTTTEVTHYQINAGDYAGSSGDSTSEFRDGVDSNHDYWHTTYRYSTGDRAIYSGEFTMVGLAFTSSATTTLPDGKKDTVTADFEADSTGTLTFVSHEGITLTAKFTDSAVASGTITGDAGGLPAHFTLDIPNGDRMTVKFSDGSSIRFQNEVVAQIVKSRQAKARRHRASLKTHG